MSRPDFNLLIVLDALLAEGSVAKAAKRLHLSPSAMSRSLARLREATGDPLLVRAGRGLVPSPRALEIRQSIGRVVEDVEAVLRPQEDIDPARIERAFTLRTGDGFVESFGPALVEGLSREAPGITLRFMLKQENDSSFLREGKVDLETGVVGPVTSPELRAQALMDDRFIGAMRPDHPLASETIDVEKFASCQHVEIYRHASGAEHLHTPIDDALASFGLKRRIPVIVDGFSSALALARATKLVASVPAWHTQYLRSGLKSFPLPFECPAITVSMLWHPRLDADPAHRWFRSRVRAVCKHALTSKT